MNDLQSQPATAVASAASLVVLAYTLLTPTNVLLGLLLIGLILGAGRYHDRWTDRSGRQPEDVESGRRK